MSNDAFHNAKLTLNMSNTLIRLLFLLMALTALPTVAHEDEFTHIRREQCVIVDGIPTFTEELRPTIAAKNYRIELCFPEFEELTAEDRKFLPAIRRELGMRALPITEQKLLYDRKSPIIAVTFSPFAYRNGKWMRIKSCLLNAIPSETKTRAQVFSTNSSTRWATRSVLSQGKWAKIRVDKEGIYQLTPDALRKMGFATPERVKVYGYGGLLQNEVLAFGIESEKNASERVPDDLTEVPTLRHNGKILFWAEGTLRRRYDTARLLWTHTTNYYSSYSYYFITEGESPLAVGQLPTITPTEGNMITKIPYSTILDNDKAGFYEGGRRLFDAHDFAQSNTRNFTVNVPDPDTSSASESKIQIAWGAASSTGATTAEFKLNGKFLGRASVGAFYSLTESARANTSVYTGVVSPGENVVNMVTTRGNHARLDYISVSYLRKLAVGEQPYSFSPLTDTTSTLQISGVGEHTHVWRIGQLGSPTSELTLHRKEDGTGLFTTDTPQRRFVVFNADREYPIPQQMGDIAPQNLHADSDLDYIIVVPTAGKLTAQAERLAEIHRLRGLNVKVVPVGQIYNEFSSGTPDANAIRRYLKMLYDRSDSGVRPPKYLLLMGKSPWDNRFLTDVWRNSNPDDYLLAYEYDASNQSIGTVSSFVTDDFYGLLDDGEGRSIYTEKVDLATGRMVCATEAEARILVDKVESYLANKDAGPWKNRIVMMADDGDANEHAEDAERVCKVLERSSDKRLNIEKIYWDRYTRVPGATSLTYPAAAAAIKEAMASGAAMFNYSGHGSPTIISNEKTLVLDDFKRDTAPHLGLWVLASCEIYPFDAHEENLADAFLFRPNAGAIAFMCATRAVYATQNNALNTNFCRHLLEYDQEGRRKTMGEALRLAKNDLIASQADLTINKMKYVLFGDPALALALPESTAKLDSIDGQAVTTDTNVRLSAGQMVRFSGHVSTHAAPEAVNENFSGTLTAEIYDRSETISGKDNDGSAARIGRRPITFTTDGHRVFRGSARVENGRFSFTAVIPRDISYSTDAARISFYAVSDDRLEECNGSSSAFHLNGTSAQAAPDTIPPKIVAYLNDIETPEYGMVGQTPTLIAEISDDSGINIAGSSMGHDIELTLDDDISSTVVLNDYFTYAPGSYNRGQIVYRLPTLSPGLHTMTLRAWDVNNNSTTTHLGFVVTDGSSHGLRVFATENPATSHTTFVAGFPTIVENDATIDWEVYDPSGKTVWIEHKVLPSKSGSASIGWNLRTYEGISVPEGVYVVRAALHIPGRKTQKATQKLIILRK